MTKNSAAVVVPAIIACLVICALVLFTCKYCYNPRFLWRLRRGDIESDGSSSDGEKPPAGVLVEQEVVRRSQRYIKSYLPMLTSEQYSVSSSSDISSSYLSEPEAIAVLEAHPDDGDPSATVIEVAPNEPPVIEASPTR
ncbi:hypothetical protein L211DRAFT_849058 [Terfezia boudieri ATCC MYA-4762]|uniref:Uncharacterized protein n=1 Tax=Terfezia boudieri ATCC MYA-4762 TaxID=1051890 RepID=A0A3N4LSX8_9PEZI|nr:hypothetical protein L211DRAFT_849058 [Terfezia boudieri ATCC MYA-4762]